VQANTIAVEGQFARAGTAGVLFAITKELEGAVEGCGM